MEPFLGDSLYIKLDRIKNSIPNLKLFLEGSEELKKHKFKFINENQIKFKDKSFPSSSEIDKRAEVLAKLYLLDIYRDAEKQMKLKDKEDEVQLQKKREVIKIQQEMEL